ncbi:MAG TPA: GntR family transcriptional regulator [Acidimicrobiales bacterium]|nr:GntR family transcriptional regulator [Acidimicrobiales bacterium]
MREIRYREIAADLKARVEAGEFAAGGVLPSESDLTKTYDASRVTIRRALEALREQGLVDSRQGFGWFVAVDRVRQNLAQLSTIERELAERGVVAERQILDFGFVNANAHVREVLGVEQVLRVRRLNLADGVPFARVTVWCPADLGAALSRADVAAHPFYELLPVTIGGATQTIAAALAEAADAKLLEVPVGSPVLRCERVTRDAEGEPVLLSVHVFPAHLTEFVVDLPSPTGLSLVE